MWDTTTLFSWTATLGKVLTIDNLQKLGLIIQDWRCMCKRSGKSVDNLFLHCFVAMDLWSLVFGMFGVQWVMPQTVVDLFCSWLGNRGRQSSILIWKMIPHHLIWCLWRECNSRHFEDSTRTIPELKLFFFHTLLDWVVGLGVGCFFYSLHFGADRSVHILISLPWVSFCTFLIKFIIYQKKYI